MTKKDKAALIEQMEKQRFLPVTDETFELYQEYNAMIDPHDPDEISYLLFYEGECYFRTGDFNQSLRRLTRCLQAPKKPELKYLDALSYNIIGLIYGYLGQENIAIDNLLLCKSVSKRLHLERESAVCYINPGITYNHLGDYETAMRYYDHALEYASRADDSYYSLKMLCQSYRGIIFCKTGQSEKALEIHRLLTELAKTDSRFFYDASVLNLNIRLFDFLPDEKALHNHLEQLLGLVSSSTDFLEMSEFYFDVCDYLVEKHMQKESAALLDVIFQYVKHSPLVFLRYEYLKCQVDYARMFSSKQDYLKACSQFIELQPLYLQEQRDAKLYSLDYIERLHQTKNDSEMYREKSRIDQMTGLLNKYTIQFLVEEDLSSLHSGRQSAMILIDMDHFKRINDTLGHLAGDSFICDTASVIHSYFEDNALCGRIGGDEFLIYFSNVTDVSFIVLQAEILRQEICRKTSKNNITITTQASIRIAFSSEERYDYQSLFAAADGALYRAKTNGRNRVVVAD